MIVDQKVIRSNLFKTKNKIPPTCLQGNYRLKQFGGGLNSENFNLKFEQKNIYKVV